MANRSLHEANQEVLRLENIFDDFAIGDRVRVICLTQDFHFFRNETGKVINNKHRYLGIIVQFDEPRLFEGGMIQETFNFNPEDLENLSYPLMLTEKQLAHRRSEKLITKGALDVFNSTAR